LHIYPKDCNAGFNFAFEDEAEKFYNIVINKIMSKTRRNNTRAANGNENGSGNSNGNHQSLNTNSSVNHMSLSAQSLNNSANYTNSKSATPNSSSLSSRFSTLKKNKKFDKTQIGAPTNFRIVQHVGLTNNDYEVS
jgi:hypothetical protein